MEIISASEFRSNMDKYVRKALSSDVIVKLRSFGSFKLIPIPDDDTLMNKEEFLAKVDKALHNIEKGDFVEVQTRDELHTLLESL